MIFGEREEVRKIDNRGDMEKAKKMKSQSFDGLAALCVWVVYVDANLGADIEVYCLGYSRRLLEACLSLSASSLEVHCYSAKAEG
jgi:hypothetical protein